jgi:hypothetical protein
VLVNAFVFQLPNRPGELAKVTEALAARGINLLVYDLGPGDQAGIALVTSDEEATGSTLGDLGVAFRETPVLTVRMEDKPGQAASTSRRLADAGVNIELWLPVDTSPDNFVVALGVDNTATARKAVSEQLTGWKYD